MSELTAAGVTASTSDYMITVDTMCLKHTNIHRGPWSIKNVPLLFFE